MSLSVMSGWAAAAVTSRLLEMGLASIVLPLIGRRNPNLGVFKLPFRAGGARLSTVRHDVACWSYAVMVANIRAITVAPTASSACSERLKRWPDAM